ncbi:MAG: ABC transporter permease [Gemmatimonadota bacterium]
MAVRISMAPAAAATLRGLPRGQRRALAARIDELSRIGLPPRAADGEPIDIPAGDHVLVGLPDERGTALVVLAIHARTRGWAGVVDVARRMSGSWRGGGGMGGWVRDLRRAARSLSRAPGYAVAAVLTLALGIGAAVGVFSVANGVLLQPLPYGDPDRVVTVWSRWVDFDQTWVSYEEYLNYRQQNRTLADAALYFTSSHTFTSTENPEEVRSAVVSPNLFSVLDVAPALGRAFTWEDGDTEAPVVLLGHDVWQRRFAADPAIVGQDVLINGLPFTVLGVMPAGFRVPEDYGSSAPSEVFFTTAIERDAPVQVPQNGGNHGYFMVARVADGAGLPEVESDLRAIAGRLEAEGIYPPEWGFRPVVLPVTRDVAGDAATTLPLLLGACLLVLLIACGNVANLTLARGDGRGREVSVRRALGAGRGRILRELLTESAVIALAAGALGTLLAAVGVRLLLGLSPASVPRSASVGIDPTVLLFALVASALAAILTGWYPARALARNDTAAALSAERGAGGAARGNRMRGLLVAAQMAMAVVLLTASGLMMRTFAGLLQVDLGFVTENVLTARITTPSASYAEPEDVARFWEDLLTRVRALPGVREAGAARLLPLASEMGDAGFNVVGHVTPPGQSTPAEWQFATPGYLEAMRIPVLRGRSFGPDDRRDAPAAMLINRAAVERYFAPGEEPLGARVATFAGDTATIVGIVGDVRHNGMTADIKPRWYRTPAQITSAGTLRRLTLVVRSERDPAALIEPVRAAVHDIDPRVALADVRTLEEVAGSALAQPRFALVLLGAFGALAFALALIGIYGVLAYAVSRRTQEIGLRMALGAAAPDVLRLVVGEGLGMAVAGVSVGVVLALASTRAMDSMLYGVDAQDPTTFVVVPLAFVLVAAVACLVPALRAARVDPGVALRHQ